MEPSWSLLATPSEGPQQVGKAIVVNLVHQRQQPANLSLWKTFARKPCQVIAGEVSQKHAFVLPERHCYGDKRLQVVRVHQGALKGLGRRRLNLTGPQWEAKAIWLRFWPFELLLSGPPQP